MKKSLLILILLLGLPLVASAAGWEAGLRGGTDATGNEENFTSGELYLLRDLSWRARLGSGEVRPRLDFGVGFLESDGDRGGWLAAGGNLVYSLAREVVELEVGFRPTWLTDHRFGADDFGGGLQFTSHAGIALHLDPLVLTYRFMHTSNGGFSSPNDGLNLHHFGLGWRF